MHKRRRRESLWFARLKTPEVGHALLPNPNFYRLLLRVDQELAEQARACRCPRCGGVLHSARYPRKPRGIDPESRSDCDSRLSFCCAQCRCRTTPVSVRFLGRRVYVAAIMAAVSVIQTGASSAAATRELHSLGIPSSTIRRWRHWWRTEFVTLSRCRSGNSAVMGDDLPADPDGWMAVKPSNQP